MSASSCIKQLLKESGMKMINLQIELGLQSTANIPMYIRGQRSPSVKTCFKIIEIAKRYKLKFTLEMLKGTD